MESSQRVLNEKLGLFGMLFEAIKIPCKNPIFIIFTCLASLPMFSSLFIYESMYLETLTEATKVLQEDLEPDCIFCYGWRPLDALERLIGKVSHNFLLLVISHLGILHFSELFSTIATVNSASSIYAGDKALNLKEMFIKHLMDSRFKGPLITSIYAVLLTLLLSLGLLSFALYAYITHGYPMFMMLFVVMFVALLTQYVEWSAIWNMGTLISILQETEGDVALVVSAHLTRGNRRSGSLLMLICLVWKLCLRILFLFIGWYGGGSKILITVVHISLLCMANVFKWVAFVIYFNECKKGSSDKKVSQSV